MGGSGNKNERVLLVDRSFPVFSFIPQTINQAYSVSKLNE